MSSRSSASTSSRPGQETEAGWVERSRDPDCLGPGACALLAGIRAGQALKIEADCPYDQETERLLAEEWRAGLRRGTPDAAEPGRRLGAHYSQTED